MSMPAARVTDMHVCPMVTGIVPHVGGPVMPPCAVTVLTGGLPQARVSDMCVCVGPPDVIVTGAFTVIVSGMPAARIGDMTAHGGTIVMGMPTVLIGNGGGASGGSAGSGGAGMGKGAGGATSFVFEAKQTSIGSEKTGAQNSQATTLKGAAKDGTPFCEQCQE